MKLFNYLLIHLEKPYQDKQKGFWIDTDWEPEAHVTTVGTVYSTPAHVLQGDNGAIIGGDGNGNPIYLSDIEPELQKGDTVYLRKRGVREAIKKQKYIDIDGKRCYMLTYNWVIAARRGDKFWPIGGYTLIEPDMETWEEITRYFLVPDDKVKWDATGKPRMKKVPVLMKTEPEAKQLRGYVRHVGTPLKGQEVSVAPGDHVIFERGTDIQTEIEGTRYYYIQSKFIHGKLEKACEGDDFVFEDRQKV